LVEYFVLRWLNTLMFMLVEILYYVG